MSGVSGCGRVAEGVLFTDGRAVLRWTLPISTIGVYTSVADLIAVHGHDGRTRLEWVDQ